MTLPYMLWSINNTMYTVFSYYVAPKMMYLVSNYGYTFGLTVYNVSKANLLGPGIIYKMIKG